MGDFAKLEKFCSKKFNLSILRALLNANHGVGFNVLLKTLTPITPRVLSHRLKDLEAEGLVQKNLVMGVLPKVEYRAMAKAEGLRKVFKELEKWGNAELKEINNAKSG